MLEFGLYRKWCNALLIGYKCLWWTVVIYCDICCSKTLCQILPVAGGIILISICRYNSIGFKRNSDPLVSSCSLQRK